MTTKAIILDIDGTLKNSRGEITPRTRDALIKAEESGILLILASGRPPEGLMGCARVLEMDKRRGLAVAYNGARVVDLETGEVLFEKFIPTETARALVRHLGGFDVQPLIMKGGQVYLSGVTDDGVSPDFVEYVAKENGFGFHTTDELDELIDAPQPKLMVHGELDCLKEHRQELSAPFAGEIDGIFSSPISLEFVAKDVDKARGLEIALEKRGISPKEAIAFGDAENDAAMLRFAGTGVAMGNAPEELKAAVDDVTASCDEDGVAVYLEKHFPEIYG